MEVEGSFSDGFSTKVFPAAIATGNIHIGTIAGGGEVDVPARLAGRRVVDVALTLGRAGPGLATDPVRDAIHAISSSASTRMARPSSPSSSVSVRGGAIRTVLPYRPPLPTSS